MPGYVIGNFFIYSIINAYTPGPGNILALNTVTDYGCKKGKPLFWGIFAGYYVVQIICGVFVFGVSAFLLQFVNVKIYLFGITALTGYITDYSASLWILLLFEIIIATIGTTATLTWVGMGALLRKAYQKYYRVINIILALILLECVYSMLK
ncbi:MAG: cysteine transporter [Lachnospiraceae bacterium]|nr:cysteine transporter [Lachnospiraceae bacterium]